MTNLLTMQLAKLIEPNNILGLYIEDTNSIELSISQRTALFTVDTLLHSLRKQTHNNAEVQKAFNEGRLKWVYFETVPLSGNFRTDYFIIRAREQEISDQLKADGFNVYEIPHKLTLTPEIHKIKYKKYRKYPIQVRILTARRTIFYVQKHFNTEDEAKVYIAGTSLINMLKDTQCCETPYRNI